MVRKAAWDCIISYLPVYTVLDSVRLALFFLISWVGIKLTCIILFFLLRKMTTTIHHSFLYFNFFYSIIFFLSSTFQEKYGILHLSFSIFYINYMHLYVYFIGNNPTVGKFQKYCYLYLINVGKTQLLVSIIIWCR